MGTFEAWKHCSNSWSIVEIGFAQGLAKVKLGGTCWRSLMLIINHQLLHEIAWNEPQNIVVGLDSNEFHELCCSHLFCRIFNISPHKSISSDELEHIIVKISLRRSKQTYHLLYLEFRRESPRWIRLGRFWKTLEPSTSQDQGLNRQDSTALWIIIFQRVI
jgi:hypothetical protein